MKCGVMEIASSTVYFRISDGKGFSRKKRVGFVSHDLLCSHLFLGYHKLSARFSQILSLQCLLVSVSFDISISLCLTYKYTDSYLKIIKHICHEK